MSLMGPSGDETLADWVRQLNSPDVFGGTPATSSQLDLRAAIVGENAITGGDFESWSAGTSTTPDAGKGKLWEVGGAGAAVAKNTTSPKIGSACVSLTAALNTETSIGQEPFETRLVSRYVTFSAWVRATTASRVRLRVNDNGAANPTFSTFHSGGGDWELLVVRHFVTAGSTAIPCALHITSGSSISAQMDGAIAMEGAVPSDFFHNASDRNLLISNHQTNTPTNQTDQGLWRSEIGEVKITTSGTPSTSASKTVTFQTAFRTIRILQITGDNRGTSDANVGLWIYSTISTSAFTTFVVSNDGTSTLEASADYIAKWLVIGQV